MVRRDGLHRGAHGDGRLPYHRKTSDQLQVRGSPTGRDLSKRARPHQSHPQREDSYAGWNGLYDPVWGLTVVRVVSLDRSDATEEPDTWLDPCTVRVHHPAGQRADGR